MHYKGNAAVQQDTIKAKEFWEKAAQKLHIKAQYNLGVIYENVAKERFLLTDFDLGLYKKIYKKPKTKKRFLEIALRYYEKAALQELPEAQFNCAKMYENQEGVDKALDKKECLNEASKYYKQVQENEKAEQSLKDKAKIGSARVEDALKEFK